MFKDKKSRGEQEKNSEGVEFKNFMRYFLLLWGLFWGIWITMIFSWPVAAMFALVAHVEIFTDSLYLLDNFLLVKDSTLSATYTCKYSITLK